MRRKIRTNLFEKKGGKKGQWRWSKVPEGYDKNPGPKAKIISVEGDKHYYSLSVVYPKGVDLKTYPKEKSEPRLRPTKQGQVVPGKIVGEVIIKNKKHPIYDTIAIFGIAGAAVLPDNERKQKADGGVESDMRRVDGTIKSERGFLGPIKNNVTGKIMTEMYITVQIGGKEVGIPALVPNLTPKQREVLVNNDFEGRGKDIPLDIQKTAKAHAVPRIEAGLSPFYQDGEENRKQNAKGGKLTARGMKHCA